MGGFVPTVRNTMSNYPSSGGTPTYGANAQQAAGTSPAQSNGAQVSALPGPRLDPSAYFTGSGGSPSVVGQWGQGTPVAGAGGLGAGGASTGYGEATPGPTLGQPGYNPADPNENPWADQDFGGGGAVGHKLGEPGYNEFDPNDNPDADNIGGGGNIDPGFSYPNPRPQYRVPPDPGDLGSMGGGGNPVGQPANEDPGFGAQPDIGQGDKNRFKQAMRHMQRGGGGIMGKPGGKMGGPPAGGVLPGGFAAPNTGIRPQGRVPNGANDSPVLY